VHEGAVLVNRDDPRDRRDVGRWIASNDNAISSFTDRNDPDVIAPTSFRGHARGRCNGLERTHTAIHHELEAKRHVAEAGDMRPSIGPVHHTRASAKSEESRKGTEVSVKVPPELIVSELFVRREASLKRETAQFHEAVMPESLQGWADVCPRSDERFRNLLIEPNFTVWSKKLGMLYTIDRSVLCSREALGCPTVSSRQSLALVGHSYNCGEFTDRVGGQSWIAGFGPSPTCHDLEMIRALIDELVRGGAKRDFPIGHAIAPTKVPARWSYWPTASQHTGSSSATRGDRVSNREPHIIARPIFPNGRYSRL
jgi:hypothetical protein